MDMNDINVCKDCKIRKECIDADIEDLYDWQKFILSFIDEHLKISKHEIAENFRNIVVWDDLFDFLDAMCQEGILYVDYGHYHLTTYGVDLIKEIRVKAGVKAK